MKKVFFLLLSISLLSAAEVRYDCLRFVERGMSHDPMLAESKFSIEEKKLKEDALLSEVILRRNRKNALYSYRSIDEYNYSAAGTAHPWRSPRTGD